MGQEHSMPTANMNRSISVMSAGRIGLAAVGFPVKRLSLSTSGAAAAAARLPSRLAPAAHLYEVRQYRSTCKRREGKVPVESATMKGGRGAIRMTRLLVLLRKAYGPRPPQCWGDGVAVLVDTILSQNTSAANSDAGYRQLRRRFRSWNQVADAPVEEVERHIRVSGLSNQKAPRIQSILRTIRQQRGKINLQFLADLPDEEAYAYLRTFPGVGPKTACCTLLFAFNKAL